MFNTKASQVKIAELFAVHLKKLHMLCSGCKYNTGKKPSRKKTGDKTTLEKQRQEPELENQPEATSSEISWEDEDCALYGDDDTLPDPFETMETDDTKEWHFKTKNPTVAKKPKRK